MQTQTNRDQIWTLQAKRTGDALSWIEWNRLQIEQEDPRAKQGLVPDLKHIIQEAVITIDKLHVNGPLYRNQNMALVILRWSVSTQTSFPDSFFSLSFSNASINNEF